MALGFASDPQFDEALKKKYELLAQNADADTMRANATNMDAQTNALIADTGRLASNRQYGLGGLEEQKLGVAKQIGEWQFGPRPAASYGFGLNQPKPKDGLPKIPDYLSKINPTLLEKMRSQGLMY
ncbi:MAG: hypothetical protein M0R00_01450 [Candidatus Omnitrophica bacterium]|jgi:hypothetical protein|nr:hypothetical protein [Candidatus Omnitrophota bacterium]